MKRTDPPLVPKRIQIITDPIVSVPTLSSFTVLGDPGCDGLGAEVLSLYAQGLASAQGSLILVAGDLVPEGYEHFYRQTDALIERTAPVPVYLLRGNHDTGAYNTHYGLSAYAVHDESTLLVVLDNSLNAFTPESLALLERAAGSVPCKDLILAMHIPPPNRFTMKAVPLSEWDKVRTVLKRTGAADKLRYTIAGHVHSYFEDSLDGGVTVVTGGAGARIAPVEGVETPYQHYVEFYQTRPGWAHRKVNLTFPLTQPVADQTLSGLLQDAYASECMAVVRYQLLAEDAEKRGLVHLAALYRAIAHAEFYHARNHFYTGGFMGEPLAGLRDNMAQEQDEIANRYPASAAYAERVGNGLAAAAFDDARRAEQVHLELLTRAQAALEQGKDIAETAYFTCTSCGATFFGEKPPRCNVCGAPPDKIAAEQ